MEKIFNIIKEFLINNFPEYLDAQLADNEALPYFTENNIIFGAVDLSRYEMPVLCAILPDNQQIEDCTIAEWEENTKVTIAFLFQKDKYDNLISKMCKYSTAFKIGVMADRTLGSRCEDSQIGNINYFYDAGAIKEQITAVEFEMTILLNNSF